MYNDSVKCLSRLHNVVARYYLRRKVTDVENVHTLITVDSASTEWLQGHEIDFAWEFTFTAADVHSHNEDIRNNVMKDKITWVKVGWHL